MQVKTKAGKAFVKLDAREHKRILDAQEVLCDLAMFAPKPYGDLANKAISGVQALLAELFPAEDAPAE